MKYFNKTTYSKPPWVRGTIVDSTAPSSAVIGARPLFSNPLDEEVYDTRFDQRQIEQMTVRDASPTDESYGGEDA
jgi:hypothetical protein